MAALQRVTKSGAWGPAIWRLEVANVLQSARRGKRITASLRDASLRDLGRLDIIVGTETDRHAWVQSLHLAERCGLTAYNAP